MSKLIDDPFSDWAPPARKRGRPKVIPDQAVVAEADPLALDDDPFAPAAPVLTPPPGLSEAPEPRERRCTILDDPFGLAISLPFVVIERDFADRVQAIVIDTDGKTATRENLGQKLNSYGAAVVERQAENVAVERDIPLLDEPASDLTCNLIIATITATIEALTKAAG